MERIAKKHMQSLFLITILLMAGCGFQPAKYFSWVGEEQDGSLQERIAEGNKLFWDGKYTEAEAMFLWLQHSDDPDVTRQALYGLACTRLIQAENRQAYVEAVEILDLWQAMSSVTSGKEDPRMLLSVFDETSQEDQAEGTEGHGLVRIFDCRKKICTLESRIDELNDLLAASEKKTSSINKMAASIKVLKKRLSIKEESEQAMAEELVKLKGQLKTLETIDQEIQEKKQGISSP